MARLIIKISGVHGYLGNLLSNELLKHGHHVSGIKRKLLYGSVAELAEEISGCDVIINLAGSAILKRWSKQNKKLIYDSRVNTTKKLVLAINSLKAEDRPKKFLSASAIGIYKAGYLHDETSTNFDAGFVGTVVKDWEKQLEQLPENMNKTIFRIGLVLGKEAKTVKNLLVPFKLCFGSKIGTGKQAFPFIHEQDLLTAFVWGVETNTTNGVFNLVAPEAITNADFTYALAKQLRRPVFLMTPGFIVKLVLGEASNLLLVSPIVKPKALLDANFAFKYPNIELALSEIIE